MSEALKTNNLGNDIDPSGNLIELQAGQGLSQVFGQLDEPRQAQVAPYIDLNRKIDQLEQYQKDEVRKLILHNLTILADENDPSFRERGIVQFFSMSSRPLSYWQTCEFQTSDGKFEDYLERVKIAVEGILSTSNK